MYESKLSVASEGNTKLNTFSFCGCKMVNGDSIAVGTLNSHIQQPNNLVEEKKTYGRAEVLPFIRLKPSNVEVFQL